MVVLGAHGDRSHGGGGDAKRRAVCEISFAHDDRGGRQGGKELIAVQVLAQRQPARLARQSGRGDELSGFPKEAAAGADGHESQRAGREPEDGPIV